jgi:hypothetical protein
MPNPTISDRFLRMIPLFPQSFQIFLNNFPLCWVELTDFLFMMTNNMKRVFWNGPCWNDELMAEDGLLSEWQT